MNIHRSHCCFPGTCRPWTHPSGSENAQRFGAGHSGLDAHDRKSGAQSSGIMWGKSLCNSSDKNDAYAGIQTRRSNNKTGSSQIEMNATEILRYAQNLTQVPCRTYLYRKGNR